jgi:hypothetical protein
LAYLDYYTSRGERNQNNVFFFTFAKQPPSLRTIYIVMLRAQRHILTASRHYLPFTRQINPFKPAFARLQHTQSKETRPGIFSPFFSPTAEEQAEEKARRNYPRQTAYDTAKYKTPPTCNKMLVRDFIDDSLYNPNYGYFSKQAVIFSPETDFDFNAMRDHLEFMNILGQLYKDIEGEADEVDEVARQVWHTPTELFKVQDLYHAQV